MRSGRLRMISLTALGATLIAAAAAQAQQGGACCWQDAPGAPFHCTVTPTQSLCDQYPNSTWHGPGTTCDDLNGNGIADACEEPSDLGACCFGPSMENCISPIDRFSCDVEFSGVFHPNANCDDLNGNGKADICEGGIQPYKWMQPPDLNRTGIDVEDTVPLVLADDFLCNREGRIVLITVWGSWIYDNLPQGDPSRVGFTLSLHSDIPAGAQLPDGSIAQYSRPGDLLWLKTFPPGSFGVRPEAMGLEEGWWDPRNPLGWFWPADSVCWRYDFSVPVEEAFCQKGSPNKPVVYWLDVQARPIDTSGQVRFGWKTSLQHWNDDAVWGEGVEPYPGPWNELRYPPGHPMHPESLDLAFAIYGADEPCPDELDWGDAPDSPAAPGYPTLSGNGGASHVIVPGFFLGSAIDAEGDGQPAAGADGDDTAGLDDEDGVVFGAVIKGKPANKVTVTASAAGFIDAWIDRNADGDWTDPGEQIFASTPVAAGVNLLTFPLPFAGTVAGPTYARFRFSSTGGLAPGGPAADGEVEDYPVRIRRSRIIGRHIFYNRSYYDGDNATINPAPVPGPNNDDDDAIDTSKFPLLPGAGTATTANYVGYIRGVNGLMIDVQDATVPPAPGDFTFFDIGRDGAAPPVAVLPTGFLARPLPGGEPDDYRCVFTFSWPTNKKAVWLECVSGLGFGLEQQGGQPAGVGDIFWYGHAFAEGQSPVGTNALVNATDTQGAKNNPHGTLNRAKVWDEYDYNKDSLVNATDQQQPKTYGTGSLNCLVLITK